MRRFFLLCCALFASANAILARDITTVTGQIYRDVKNIRVDKTGIGFFHRDGSAFLFFSALPPEVRVEFDPNAVDPDSALPPPALAHSPDIVALDGNFYQDVRVDRVERTGIRITHRNGTGFLDYANAPTSVRKRYGYSDAAYAAGLALKLKRQQVAMETQQRIAAENAAREAEARLRQQKAEAALAALQTSIANRDYSNNNYVNRDYSTNRYSGSSGGSVQVNGFYRSNGTYVHSYTRGGRGK